MTAAFDPAAWLDRYVEAGGGYVKQEDGEFWYYCVAHLMPVLMPMFDDLREIDGADASVKAIIAHREVAKASAALMVTGG